MLIMVKSICFLSVLVTVLSSNSYRESYFEISKEVCEPEFIYCIESNVCIKADCIHDNINKPDKNIEYCPPQTNYCIETDECLPNCPKNSINQENKYASKSTQNSKNDKQIKSSVGYVKDKNLKNINNEAILSKSPPSVGIITSKANPVTTQLNSNDITTVAKVSNKSILTITITIDTDFDTFIGNNMTSTKAHLISELTQMFHISKSMIINLIIIRGSVSIIANLSDNGQVNEQDLVNKHYTLTDLKGRQYSVKSVSSQRYVDSSKTHDLAVDSDVSESEFTSTKTTDDITDSLSTVKPILAQESSSVQTEMKTMSVKELQTSGSTEEMITEKTITTSLNLESNITIKESVTEMSTTTTTTTTRSTESTAMSAQSTLFDTKSIVSMSITIEGDYDTVVGGDKQHFLNNVKKQLANYLRVPLICIINMDSRQGSIIVVFELIPSNDPNFLINGDAIKSAKLEFEHKIKQNQIFIVDSAGISHKVLSSVDFSGHKTENNRHFYSGNYLLLGLAIGAIVVMVVLIIVTACVVRSYMYRKYQRQIRPRTSSEISRTDQYHNEDTSSPNTIRMIEDITREGANSSGQCSYDSGVWVGNVPKPVAHDSVPEPPKYLPPNEMEISITPKLPPNVLNKFRRKSKSEEHSVL